MQRDLIMAVGVGAVVPGPALPQLGLLRLARADPATLVAKARRIGLTHLAITDHERIDGALRARDLAPAGPDASSWARRSGRADGDLIGLFLERAVPPGLSRRRDGGRDPRAGRPGRPAAPLRPVPVVGRQPGRGTATRRSTRSPPPWTTSRSTTRAPTGMPTPWRRRSRTRTACPAPPRRTPTA